MLDKEIRNTVSILIKGIYPGAKIFSEFAIGDSFADLFVVTSDDKIIGLEIKSDKDNFKRLRKQADDYEDYCDINYLVVGKKHAKDAIDLEKREWGIIQVDETGVKIIKKPKKREFTYYRTRKLLELLWEIELKEILLECGLYLCPQKPKEYIIQYLLNELDDKDIHCCVTSELYRRETSFVPDFDYVLGNEAQLADLLSERDVTLDYWISIFTEAQKIKERKNKRARDFEKQHKQLDFDVEGIKFYLGCPYIKPYIIDQFIIYLGKIKGEPRFTSYDNETGTWKVDDNHFAAFNNEQINYVYGVPNFNCLKIIECILNNRPIAFIKSVNGKRVEDKATTIVLLDKARIINDEFQKWIMTRIDLLASIKRQFNNLLKIPQKKMEHGKEVEAELSLTNISKSFNYYPYQKDAIATILSNSNTLLAFDVGSGKTAIMVGAAMCLRYRHKLFRPCKNMFVVPNSIVGQWEKMFLDIFPKARVLAIGPKDFTPSKRIKVLNMIRTGDYDGIIIAYSCFEQIELSSEYKMKELNTCITQLENGVRPLELMQSKNTYKNLVKKIYTLIEDIKVNAYTKEPNLCFDRLGINYLFIDEAHNYKNLPIQTSMRNLLGINIKGSPKCKDLLDKVRCVQKQNNGGGVVFATGTPLSNSIADAYNMQVYLQPDILRENKLIRFDDWVKTFSQCEESMELDVTGINYRATHRFKRFVNLDILSRIFSASVIYYAKKDLKKLPLFKGYTDVVLPQNEDLKNYMIDLANRADAIRNKKVDKKQDNMLKVSTDGRKAALDIRLVDSTKNPGNRLEECANNVYNIYIKDNDSTQVIFSDFSTPKESFNVYQELKSILINKGVKKKDIVFIHNYNDELKRLELFNKINNSKVRIIIGSTFKLGIGVNIQKHLKAVHHLDVPWRPADMVQREGRIIRPGNTQKEVRIYRYITKGSFDGYSWQLLENKQRFITEFLSGTGYQKEISDLEENVLSYAEAKALALNEPLIKKIAETENEIAKTKILMYQEEGQIKDIIAESNTLDKEINRMLCAIRALEYAAMYGKPNIHVSLYNKYVASLKSNEPIQSKPQEMYKIGLANHDTGFWYRGLHVCGPYKWKEKKYIKIISNYTNKECCFAVEIGDSSEGNVTRLRNFLNKMPETINKIKQELKVKKDRQAFLLTQNHSTDNRKIQLIELNERLAELKSRIKK